MTEEIVSSVLTPDRQQLKMLILSTKVDKKLLETEFLIDICHPTGDKWQSKTLFPATFDLCLSIVESIFNCCLSGVVFVNRYCIFMAIRPVGSLFKISQNM